MLKCLQGVPLIRSFPVSSMTENEHVENVRRDLSKSKQRSPARRFPQCNAKAIANLLSRSRLE